MNRVSSAHYAPTRVPYRAVRRRRSLRLGRVIALVAMSTVVALQVANAGQDVFTFTDFSDKSSLTMNGNTPANNPAGQTFLRLTSGTGQAGSAFISTAVTLTTDASFSTNFSFRILNNVGSTDSDGQTGADGITFVVQTVANTAGGGGGGIGYAGLADSVAVEFDTWNNGADDNNDGNHVGIDLEGSTDSLGTVTPITPFINDGNTWYAWVDYNGATDLLEVRLSQVNVRPVTATTSATVDLPTVLGSSNAFVGFTSGTGAAGGDHDILTWTFINAFNPVGVNAAPDANAGPDQSVAQTGTATSVTLNGSGSTDPDGDTLTFSWAGPFNGGTATGATPTVTFATAGAHTVTLTVNDGNGGTDTDTVVINVLAPGATLAPTAAALPDTLTSTADAPAPLVPAGLALLGLAAASYAIVALRRRAVPRR